MDIQLMGQWLQAYTAQALPRSALSLAGPALSCPGLKVGVSRRKIDEPDEIAARFHHRLVAIHPYPNGNGRHARLAADLLLKEMGHERFTWGHKNLTDAGKTRSEYIAALGGADGHNYGPLLEFVRS